MDNSLSDSDYMYGNGYSLQETSKRLFDVLEVLEVHVVKSEEVRTVPNVPTTTT